MRNVTRLVFGVAGRSGGHSGALGALDGVNLGKGRHGCHVQGAGWDDCKQRDTVQHVTSDENVDGNGRLH